MAKVARKLVEVYNPVDHNEVFAVQIDVMVSKEGEFYCTLDDVEIARLVDAGIDLNSTWNNRLKRWGTFRAKSMAELIGNLKKIMEEAVSGEVLEDKFVILYSINTRCSYCISEGLPVPNGQYVTPEEMHDNRVEWIRGTDINTDSNFGFYIYAQIYHKQVIRFKSGKEKTFFWAVDYNQRDKLGEYGKRLNAVQLSAYSIRDAYKNNSSFLSLGDKKEIIYTEENAEFFYNLLMAVCSMNEQIKHFIKEPELLQQVIDSRVKLLQ